MVLSVIGQTETAEALRRVCAAGTAGVCLADADDLKADAAAIFASSDEIEDAVCRAAERGLNVLLPGSACADAVLLRRLNVFFRERERKLVLLFEGLFDPAVRDVRRTIEKDALGRIGVVDLLKTAPAGEDARGMLAEALAVAEFWLGCAEEMRIFASEAEATRCAALNAAFRDGALLNLQVVSGTNASWQTVWELSGSRGNLAFDSVAARSVKVDGCPPKRYPAEGTELCPLTNMLRELPQMLETHGIGVSEDCLDFAERLSHAAMKGWRDDG